MVSISFFQDYNNSRLEIRLAIKTSWKIWKYFSLNAKMIMESFFVFPKSYISTSLILLHVFPSTPALMQRLCNRCSTNPCCKLGEDNSRPIPTLCALCGSHDSQLYHYHNVFGWPEFQTQLWEMFLASGLKITYNSQPHNTFIGVASVFACHAIVALDLEKCIR